MDINEDIVMGKWRRIKGRLKRWRGGLTHNNLERVMGQFEEEVGLVQERYGVAAAHAKRVVHRLARQPRS